MRTYVPFTLLVIVVGVMFGYVLPALVSHDSELAWVGVVLTVMSLPAFAIAIEKLTKRMNKCLNED